MEGNTPSLLNAVSAKRSKSQSFNLLMLASVAGKGRLSGRVGSGSTLFPVSCVLFFTSNDCIVMGGFGNSLGNIPTSMQAALLKYNRFIFSLM